APYRDRSRPARKARRRPCRPSPPFPALLRRGRTRSWRLPPLPLSSAGHPPTLCPAPAERPETSCNSARCWSSHALPPGPQSGILSCFFHGLESFFVLSEAKARATRLRVEWGMITSSMKPFSAATKGLAKRSSSFFVRAASFRLAASSAREGLSPAPFAPLAARAAGGQAQLHWPRRCFDAMTSEGPPEPLGVIPVTFGTDAPP